MLNILKKEIHNKNQVIVSENNGYPILIIYNIKYNTNILNIINNSDNNLFNIIDNILITEFRNYKFPDLIKDIDHIIFLVSKEIKKEFKNKNIEFIFFNIVEIADVFGQEIVFEYRKGLVEGVKLIGMSASSGQDIEQLADKIASAITQINE